jgi:hypothetical protein
LWAPDFTILSLPQLQDMRTLCHCSEQATASIQGVQICAKCEDFLTRHPALESILIKQWKTMRDENQLEQSPDGKT